MNTTSTKQRRSLKGTLRTILGKCRRQVPEDVSGSVGSGILRRDPSLPILSNGSTTAFLLGLETAPYHDEYDNNDIPDRFDISSLATSAAMSSTRTLMPKISLGQFELYHPPIQEVKYLQRGRSDSVWSSVADGASYQASLITLRSFRSSSTLRIQSSTQSLRSESDESCILPSFPERFNSDCDPTLRSSTAFQCPSPPRSSPTLSPRRSLLRKRPSFGTVSSPSPLRQISQPVHESSPISPPYNIPYDYSSRFTRPLSVIEEVASYVSEPVSPRPSLSPRFIESLRTPTPSRTNSPILRPPSTRSSRTNPLVSVKHFTSFCALDMVTPGCPITATSTDLKYIFDLGDNFCLNNQGCDETSMDVITGVDAAGNPVTHLVLFSPLVIPHSGRSRFMLASLVDVTDFLHDTASLPELEMASDRSVESDPPTPKYTAQPFPKGPKYQLSAESLLGGCFVEEPRTPVQRYDEDIWLNLATEERKHYSQKTEISSGSRTPISATSSLSSVDDMLETFMCKLQDLHSDFFLLAKSPLDDSYYEICNVSPKVYEDRDYVNGHLSKTSATDMMKLSSQLAGDDAFDMKVRWGEQGVVKHLYCTPLFARSAVTWICFLVDGGLPTLRSAEIMKQKEA